MYTRFGPFKQAKGFGCELNIHCTRSSWEKAEIPEMDKMFWQKPENESKHKEHCKYFKTT